MPKRVVLRYSDLTLVEITDLTNAASRISKVLEQVYPHMRNGFIWLIQDGKEAGQTVPHVHLHIIPKRFSEWSQHGIEDVNRVPRTLHDMKLEAKHLESMLRQNI
ncbi:hypothetical protein CU098_008567 [Rhizopus stolonifer]|uniref:HIT domain-containing protein n=2 Tax=Mucorineae TaxID=1344963 RepID=A0A367K0E7_RHIST|nr:hypothetical protein CU098_008567 [Rhizopus stolonifer]